MTAFAHRASAAKQIMRIQIRPIDEAQCLIEGRMGELECTIALCLAPNNFCGVHKSLRISPAMKAGTADYVWTIAELIA